MAARLPNGGDVRDAIADHVIGKGVAAVERIDLRETAAAAHRKQDAMDTRVTLLKTVKRSIHRPISQRAVRLVFAGAASIHSERQCS